MLLKRRALTALKVIKVLRDCVCDSPAGRDVLHTHRYITVGMRSSQREGGEEGETVDTTGPAMEGMSLSSFPPLIITIVNHA